MLRLKFDAVTDWRNAGSEYRMQNWHLRSVKCRVLVQASKLIKSRVYKNLMVELKIAWFE